MKNTVRYGLLLLPAATATFLGFLFPMAQIASWSVYDHGFTSVNFGAALGDGVYRQLLWTTLTLSLQVAVLCVVIGYPVAYYLSSLAGTKQRVLILAITFPLWVSVLIRTYTWIVVLGREGLLNSLLSMLGITDGPLQLIFTRGAVLVAMVQVLLPPAILVMFGVMMQINRSLIRAARVLGATPAGAFRLVFLPLSMSGVTAAMILTFVLSLGFYVTPALVGGPKDLMVSNIIAAQINQTLNWGFGSALGIVLLATGLLTTAIIALVLGPFSGRGRDGGSTS